MSWICWRFVSAKQSTLSGSATTVSSLVLLPPIKLARAVKLDMADWWTPTGKSYLERVKKSQILEAIKEGTGETNFEDLRKMKKTELVAVAQWRLAGSRWLPEILKS